MTHYWSLQEVISGGQTGADIAFLRAARDLQYRTGGMMPKGFKTERGNRPDYAALYGMKEHDSAGYPSRTRANVMRATGTIIIGKLDAPGSQLTAKFARLLHRPFMMIEWPMPDAPVALTTAGCAQAIREWILTRQIRTLNGAGNRESTNPGIEQAVYDLMMQALQPLEVEA